MSEAELTIIKLLIGGVFGSIATAYITVWRTKYTVRSADFSKRVSEVSERIDLICNCACRVWSNIEHSDPIFHNKHYLIGLISGLTDTINALETEYKNFHAKPIKNALFELSNACTGGDFLLKDVKQEFKVRSILKYGELLKNELYRTRLNKY